MIPAGMPSRWSGRAYAGAAFVVLVLLGFGAILSLARLLDAEATAHAEAERVRLASGQLIGLRASLLEAESAVRGFVVTGDRAFVAQYEAVPARIGRQIEAMRAALAGSSTAAQADLLAGAIDAELAQQAELIQLRDGGNLAAAVGRVAVQREDPGQVALQAQLDALRVAFDGELGRVEAESTASTRRSQQFIMGLIVLALAIVLVTGALLVRDLHLREQAESDLRRSNSVLEATMNSVQQGIGVFDEHLQLLAWNPQFALLRGLDPASVHAGLSFKEVVRLGAGFEDVTSRRTDIPAPADPHEVFARLDHVKELRRPDGMILEVRGHLRDDGKYILTYTDVTPIKQSELAFREQATRLAAVMDAAVDGIITINESGSIESWSKGAERLFGYRAEEVLHRNVNTLMRPDQALLHDGHLQRYLETGVPHSMGTRREVEGLHRDGRQFPVEVGLGEMRLGSQRLYIGVVRDISERKAVERLKSEFVSTVSHELRTPLTSIAGALGLLAGQAGGELPPKARRLVDIARQNSDRLIRLINDILDLDKAEAGRLDFHCEVQPVRPVVEAALDAARGLAESRRVRLQLDPPDTDGPVRVDRDRLLQVLANLLSNAIKFSPEGGDVHVDIRRDAGHIRVRVRDRGPGIPAAFRQHIFQKFAQADASDARTRGGTGLGLSIAQALTEGMGGTIGYTSNPGEGATFWVGFPEAPAEALPLPTTSPLPTAGSRVLLCEDDPDVAEVLKEQLLADGLVPVVAATAEQARHSLATQTFDVALIDLHLPDANGLDLIGAIRSNPELAALPVIVMTATVHPGASTLVHSLRLADWLRKPVDPRRLLASIEGALGGSGRRYRVLHVEDDPLLAEMVKTTLDGEAVVTVARTLADARARIRDSRPDLVVLDVELGDGSGLELLPLLRDEPGTQVPVVLYSATEASREIALQVEAALVKSRDSLEQLLGTVRTLARRGSVSPQR